MNRQVELWLRAKGRLRARAFDRAAEDPKQAQAQYLRTLLHQNRDTAFGREHGFDSIRNPRDYAARVPVRDYDGLRPWVERLAGGERNVLTRHPPLLFGTTSGTTGLPKLVPVTRPWARELRALLGLWLYKSLHDHPRLLSGKSGSLVSPAVEGAAPDGTPTGSVSGLTYRSAPWIVRRTYAVPYAVSEIADYDHRYLVAVRFLFAASVSLLAAPNPSTLLRIASEGETHSETIVRAVHDGALGVDATDSCRNSRSERQLYAALDRAIRPDRARARDLEAALRRDGKLLPQTVWPQLAMIGCWLGGSAGVQARRLSASYGDVPVRDLGFRATEATVTVPHTDGTAAGPLAVHVGFHEFVPEEQIEDEHPPVLLAHELEEGARYYILLTTSAGLYRYDINDVVEVHGFYRRAPELAFVRKGRDMVNLTGEKLHSFQIAQAAELAAGDVHRPDVQIQLIPDANSMRYDLLTEGVSSPELEIFAGAFDRHLATLNIEYDQKRASRRLGPPNAIPMNPGWAVRHRQFDVEHGGKRDTQYKWPYFRMEWDERNRSEIENGESSLR
ncbi:MAG: GH3 auxin-responsive promoter family protein [Candidatus Poribacteria bacterium]